MSAPAFDRYAGHVLHAMAWGCSGAAHVREYARLSPKNLRQHAADQILLRVVAAEFGVRVC